MSAYSPSTFYELLRQRAETDGDAVAVQALNAPDLTYRELVTQLARVIEALASWGIGRGDRVMIQLANGAEPLLAFHGVGAVAVAILVDPRASVTEMDYFLRFIEPVAILLQQGVNSSGRELAQQYNVRVIEIIPTPDAGAGTFTFVDPVMPTASPLFNGPEDLSYLVTTSGTTTLPKLVPKTQTGMLRTIGSPVRMQQRVLGATLPLRAINYVPMQFVGGFMIASAAIGSGGRVACMPGFDLNQVYPWLDRYQPDFLSGSPAMLDQIVALAPQYQDVIARLNIRYIFTGSAAFPETTRAALDRVFGLPINNPYGMTEVSSIAQMVLRPGDVVEEGSVGQLLQPENVRVLADDGRFLPANQVGELLVRSDMFMGYWNNPEANAEAFVDGWFRTGDMARVDENNTLFLIGRVKEVINNGGAKVSPYEVESVLKLHLQVKEAVVFGLKHAEVGETVAAAVIGDVSERELRKFAAERLPFYKVPTRIISVEAIPTTASGKYQRNRLPELLGLT